MDKCKRERLQITSLRSGIAVAAGLALWFLSSLVAPTYGFNLAIQGQIAVSLAGMIATWFATRPMFSFTQECLAMQEATCTHSEAPETSNIYLPQQGVATATGQVTCNKKDPDKKG